ncbi:MAG TPA: aminoglycoside phosphotransferase family protein [Mycobacteriales bacterium]|nr:aminoglycoside phosphotransferase family protein [Mycobacteriales bacterium]
MQLDRAQQLIDHINAAHGFRFTLQSRYQDGVVGAWSVMDPEGRRAVLKGNDGMAHRIARLPQIVERIRAAGYPTPAWIVAGVTDDGGAYHLVDFAPGEPMSNHPLTAESAAQLVAVIETQVGFDPDPQQDWSGYMPSAAFGESEGDPRPEVRRIGRPGVELLEHFDAVLAPYRGFEVPRGDLVHGDFNTCNVLIDKGKISGVIDVDACGSGTRAVDYAWLLREAYVRDADPQAIATIRRAGEAVAGPGVLTICAAATAFDIIRFQYTHEPESAPGILPGLHRLADALE